MPDIAHNLDNVRQRIQQAATAAGSDGSEITLVAVSKRHPVSAIEQAINANQYHFGENYVQEAVAKIAQIENRHLIWHFIGPIQSNKTRAIAENFSWVHTVDRIRIAERLSRQRPTTLAPLNTCIQVNIDQEARKAGVAPGQVIELAQHIQRLPMLQLRGLMCIPRADAGEPAFARMHELFIKCKEHKEFAYWDTLSMGMSADLELAIANGANVVRIGTDIFGPRD